MPLTLEVTEVVAQGGSWESLGLRLASIATLTAALIVILIAWRNNRNK